MTWISVKERLPGADGLYLVACETLDADKPFIAIGWYNPSGFGWSHVPIQFITSVRYWMQIPLIPEMKVEEEVTFKPKVMGVIVKTDLDFDCMTRRMKEGADG